MSVNLCISLITISCLLNIQHVFMNYLSDMLDNMLKRKLTVFFVNNSMLSAVTLIRKKLVHIVLSIREMSEEILL